ncbi:MAG: hypothetical protein ACOY3P_04845, partial [Planctomycetota bacterium]
ALGEGVDPAQLLEQLLGTLRDTMLAAIGCPADLMLYVGPQSEPVVAEAGKRWGLATILAAIQIVDHTLARLRVSTQSRVLAELALVRMCTLGELDDLADLISRWQSAAGSATAQPVAAARAPMSLPRLAAPESRATASAKSESPKQLEGEISREHADLSAQPQTVEEDDSPRAGKKNGPTPTGAGLNPPSAVAAGVAAETLTEENATALWAESLARISGMIAEQARQFDRVSVAAPNRLVVSFKPNYALAKAACERPDQVARFESAMAQVAGHPVHVEFRLADAEPSAARPVERMRSSSPHQRLLEVMRHPMVHRAAELLGAQPLRVDDPPRQTEDDSP